MEWSKLLCEKRPSEKDGKKVSEKEGLWSSPFERDYYTIVSSSYFRRLQKKAQVYVLDDNDYIRTRLTHSMEVSSIAEILGKRIGEKVVEELKIEALPVHFLDDLPMVLRCAGLLHDLGNPPFGHAGEEYIRDFFQENESKLKKEDELKIDKKLSNQMWFDFINFDGNAHNIRIVSKLGKSSNPNDKGYGMDLTSAVINSLIKYPYNSEIGTKRRQKEDKKKRGKIGFYHSEEWIIQTIVAPNTGTKVSENEYLKNPIMLIMEAADDIAYATADVEDAVKKGVLEKCEIIQTLKGVVPEDIIDKDKADDREIGATLNYVRESAMLNVIDNFILNYQCIMDGTYQGELIDDSQNGIKELKQLINGYFEERDKEAEIKFNPKKKISDIMDYLISCIIKDDNAQTFSDWLVLDEMRQYIVKNEREVELAIQHEGKEKYDEDLYHKYMAVVDFVSGMTDSYVSIFWNKLFSGELVREKRKAFKEKCLKDIICVRNFDEANKTLKDIARVDIWDDYEIEIILKCYLNNNQISNANSSGDIIPILYKKVRKNKLGRLLTKKDKEKLEEMRQKNGWNKDLL